SAAGRRRRRRRWLPRSRDPRRRATGDGSGQYLGDAALGPAESRGDAPGQGTGAMSRLVDNSLALVLAVSWLGGLLLFPRALEPGRADLNGIELNLLVDRGDGRTQN